VSITPCPLLEHELLTEYVILGENSQLGILQHSGRREVTQNLSETHQRLDALEMTLHEHLTTALWAYYIFCQTNEQVDWQQPLLTVSLSMGEVGFWEAAQRCRCFEALSQELCNAMLQFVGAKTFWL
jgi:hypothetical protein